MLFKIKLRSAAFSETSVVENAAFSLNIKKEVKKMTYNKPSFEKVASFKDNTMGLWYGKFRDIFGAKTYFNLAWT